MGITARNTGNSPSGDQNPDVKERPIQPLVKIKLTPLQGSFRSQPEATISARQGVHKRLIFMEYYFIFVKAKMIILRQSGGLCAVATWLGEINSAQTPLSPVCFRRGGRPSRRATRGSRISRAPDIYGRRRRRRVCRRHLPPCRS